MFGYDNSEEMKVFLDRVAKCENEQEREMLEQIKHYLDYPEQLSAIHTAESFLSVKLGMKKPPEDIVCKIAEQMYEEFAESYEDNPFFIISENRGRAVAIKKENMLCYLERQQRGGRSSFDYIQSVIYSIFIGDNFLARKILYYNPKTKTISGVCNEDRG